MSVKVSALCWRVPLPAMLKVVLARLADYASDSGGSIYPAIGTLAEECGLSRRKVQTVLHDLTALGVLRLVEATAGGRGRTNRYALVLPRIAELAGAGKPDHGGPNSGGRAEQEQAENHAHGAGFNGSENHAPGAGIDLNPAHGARNHAHEDINPAHGAPDSSESVNNHREDDRRAHARARQLAERVAAIAGMPERLISPGRVEAWLAAGYDPERDIIPAVEEAAGRARGQIHSFRYFDREIMRHHDDRTAPLPERLAPNVHRFQPAFRQDRPSQRPATGSVAAARPLAAILARGD